MRRAIGYLGAALLWTVVALCAAITVVPAFLDYVYYDGQVTGHYDGERFFNPGPDDIARPSGGRRGNIVWRYLTGSDRRPDWPTSVAVTPSKPAPRVEGQRMVSTWVGHATVLVQTQGLNILTDPIWSDAAGPFGIGPTRVAQPGVRFEDLPKVDLVLVSHNHYDHMDLATLKRLWDRDRPLIVTSLGNETVIAQAGVKAKAIDWGARLAIKPGVDVVVTRNHHWSSRWFADRNRALWSSFTVVLPGGNLFFAGDTGFGDGEWPREAARLGPVRYAIVPIGAFRFFAGQLESGSHIGPNQASEVFARLGATTGLGMHWGTFRLSYEAYDTPPRLLAEVMRCRGMAGFGTARIGAPIEIPAYAAPVAPRATMAACRRTAEMERLK